MIAVTEVREKPGKERQKLARSIDQKASHNPTETTALLTTNQMAAILLERIG
ncbi:hypothetical protein [Microcoleus sp. bin38.metabat.b11b12b14.051]|uniref:hypothetical protein n=1 Tax=Microcoleus sp. bin38.metabat.b11b12b14.051 TaxID=2742709 RepID=UPI002600FAB2|nr:hypothetical protein [Microcoleus sp. bin38.metabat.b11b12b14.051]